MWKNAAVIFCVAFVLFAHAFGQSSGVEEISPNQFKYDVFKVLIEPRHQKSGPEGEFALAFYFELEKDWHFYASEKTAPGGVNLRIKPMRQESLRFSEARLPEWESYFDPVLKQKIDVFSDKFTVILPFSVEQLPMKSSEQIVGVARIGIEGAYCSAQQCRIISDFQIDTKMSIAGEEVAVEAKLVPPDLIEAGPKVEPDFTVARLNYPVWFALGLAFLAGLSLNIMPCVWPVLPLIVMRIVEQAKQGKGKSIAMGLAFCVGILLFFACLAGANIILQLFYGTVLQWGDQFRNPVFVAGMALLLVVLALFMFGVFTITVPSSIAGKSGSAKGYSGAVGMGFLAAILSTPCSFGILAAAFAWAQGQHLALGTLTIMVIGVGMAAPYAILTSMPGLLKGLPKGGRWMELFKQTVGFVLLVVAVKLIGAVPEVRRMGVLYFAVVLGFCIWMWGGWVSYNTKPSRKWLIRIIAVALAVAAGWVFLPAPADELIDWQKYDADLIEKYLTEKKAVLIKFTADWCFNCLVLEKTVYSSEDIANLIEQKNVLAVKADTTVKDYPATLALKDKYQEPGVPVAVLHLPDGTEHHLQGLISRKDLKKILANLPDAED